MARYWYNGKSKKARRQARKNYYRSSKYKGNLRSNFTKTANQMLENATREKRALIAIKYMEQLEKKLREMEEAKEALMSGLWEYRSILEEMVKTQVWPQTKASLNELISSMQDFTGQAKIQMYIEKYQKAMAEGQHLMYKIQEDLTGGTMNYNIMVGGKVAKEYSLNLNALMDLETAKFNSSGQYDDQGESIFDLVVDIQDLKELFSAQSVNPMSRFRIGEQTKRSVSNLQMASVLENVIGRNRMGNTVMSEMVASINQDVMSDLKQQIGTVSGKQARASDVYERYIAQRVGAYQYLTKEAMASHNSYTAASGGDINYFDVNGKFMMIQAKYFNQANNLNIGFNQIGNNQYGYLFGFQNLADMGNISNALYAYQDRLEAYAMGGFDDYDFDDAGRQQLEDITIQALRSEAASRAMQEVIQETIGSYFNAFSSGY